VKSSAAVSQAEMVALTFASAGCSFRLLRWRLISASRRPIDPAETQIKAAVSLQVQRPSWNGAKVFRPAELSQR